MAGRRALALILLLAGLLVLLSAQAGGQEREGALVDVLEIDGVVDRHVAASMRAVLEKAQADGADLVVFSLDTPGGLRVSAEDLAGPITASEVPVLTFVPTSAQATGAGALIAQASHVLALSPVSRMGALSPVDLAGGGAGESAERLAGLAQRRGRNPEFAVAAAGGQVLTILAAGATPEDVPTEVIGESDDILALTPAEALDGGYVDLVEPELNTVLERLSGYTVAVEGADGVAEDRVLDIDGLTAQVRFNSLGLVQRMLHAASSPTLAYLLFMSGALALAFEVFQPGFGVAGISGLILAALGLYGLAVLPVNWLAFAALVVGLVLLAVDLAVAGFGLLTLAGTVAVGLGSFLLLRGPDVLSVPAWVLASGVAFTVAFFLVIMTTVLRAQGVQASAGAAALVGQTGVVRSVLNPEGHVFVGGALWRARAPGAAGRVRTGTVVRVLGLDDGPTLEVQPLEEREDTPVS